MSRRPSHWLPPLPGKPNPCANCPPITPRLHMRRRIAVGLGYAAVERNGKPVFIEGEDSKDWNDAWTVQKAENRARKRRGDWRIVLHGPLHGETYQRQGRNNWVLVEKNGGFA